MYKEYRVKICLDAIDFILWLQLLDLNFLFFVFSKNRLQIDKKYNFPKLKLIQ